MIERLRLTNFKAFDDLKIELRPLTVLIGPNNTGKSSILAGLRLLAQTLDASDPRVGLLLDGALGDFGTFTDIVHGNKPTTSFSLCLSGESPSPFQYPPEPDDQIQWEIRVAFSYRTRRRQLIISEMELADGDGHVVTVSYVPKSDHHVVSKMAGTDIPAGHRAETVSHLRLRNFVPTLMFGHYTSDDRDPLGGLFSREQLDQIDRRIDRVGWAAFDSLRTIEYIGGMRAAPERTYHQTGEGRQRIGAQGENWAGILVLDSARTGTGGDQLAARLGTWLQAADLASEVKLNWLSDRHYEVQIKNPTTGEVENLADVGQGNSQIIPVLLGGFRLREGSLYLVEEPEIHLHPRAQAELGDYFLALHQAGVRSIVETHSEYLLVRLQQHVAAGSLDPDDVAFYYVDAARSGRKRVRKLTLDEHARFKQKLPGGFFPQRLEEARKLARLRA